MPYSPLIIPSMTDPCFIFRLALKPAVSSTKVDSLKPNNAHALDSVKSSHSVDEARSHASALTDQLVDHAMLVPSATSFATLDSDVPQASPMLLDPGNPQSIQLSASNDDTRSHASEVTDQLVDHAMAVPSAISLATLKPVAEEKRTNFLAPGHAQGPTLVMSSHSVDDARLHASDLTDQILGNFNSSKSCGFYVIWISWVTIFSSHVDTVPKS